MKRSLLILLVVLIVLVSRATAHSASATVTLRAQSEVRSAQPVRVADVAGVQGPQQLSRKIGEVVVATGPLPGERRILDAGYVKARVNAIAPGCGLKLAGPEQVTIVGKCVRISVERLDDEVKNFTLGQLPQDGRTYDITIERSPRGMVLADAPGVEIRCRTMSSCVRPGPNTIGIDALAGGKAVATQSAAIQVKVVADVLVATNAIAQGSALTDQNTRYEQRDVTRVSDAVVARQDADAGSMVARRTIRAGAVITSSDVASPPAVRSGDTVTLTVKCGSVTLSTTAEARQDGRVGENIRVRSTVSESDVRARVTGPGIVEINR